MQTLNHSNRLDWQPDDDLPNIPTLTPLDSAQARRAWAVAPALGPPDAKI